MSNLYLLSGGKSLFPFLIWTYVQVYVPTWNETLFYVWNCWFQELTGEHRFTNFTCSIMSSRIVESGPIKFLFLIEDAGKSWQNQHFSGYLESN